ncbi:uncharacterized protein SPSK_07869 [Sporothrix schenckii 1099-18]|uniref:Uncharacterized protein n=1 Tax=Sporothrix schenckii 1099-18 TaxID=1397361 RepID=A0A0F2MH19_SPOSC|nr:uncharacterized protein SPSK_07869 [Sporothrix schenckii 1099-18]KJR88374.1 hypothetical protein SPSK_07869 [Sporothrix schenckii 1099-18]
MSRPESTPPPRRPPAAKAQISPEVADILVPSLQVGLGAASGIVRSTTPVLFSLVTGAQWFALGSSYYGSRSAIISAWGGESTLTPWDNVKASTLAGASAGFVGGSLRGPRNILPAVAIFSIFGASGQAVLNAMSTGATPDAKSKSDWLASKWSPVTPMTDTEYATFIQDKILKLDVEVSMIDDQLAALRARKAQREAENPQREDS